MKAVCYAALLLAVPASANPVGKVIQMLEEMKANGQKELQDEKVLHAEQAQWCDDTIAHKKEAIAEAEDTIAQLTADIQKAAADSSNAANEANRLRAAIEQATADIETSKKERAAAKKSFEANQKDLEETVDALQRAMIVLKKNFGNIEQDQDFFMQLASNPLIPDADRSALESFLEQGKDGEAYSFKSSTGKIIEMIQGLTEKFQGELNDARAADQNDQHASNMVQMDLNGQIDSDKAALARQNAEKGAADKNKGAAEGEKSATEHRKAGDETFLADTTQECTINNQIFGENQNVRENEIVALGEAIKIMKSSDVEGNNVKVSTVFVQVATLANMSPKQDEASTYLLQQSQHYKSKLLEEISDSVAADPFNKVKRMIRSMIDKLQNQALEEAEHKGWCDKEMKVNKQVREEKTTKVDELTATRDEQNALINRLASEVQQIESESNAMTKALSEATKERADNKNENEKTISDAKEAQVAVTQALEVLKQFYDNPSGAFLQQNEDAEEAMMQLPGAKMESYAGQQEGKGGVLALMQQVLEDFARVETDTRNQESTQENEYQEFKTDTNRSLAVNKQTVDNKQTKKARTESDMQKTVRDLEGTQEELDAANRYHEKLKPSCVHQQPSHEERMAQRQAEIDSLKEALRILA